MSSYRFPTSMPNEVKNRQASLLEQIFGGRVGSLGSQPSEQPRVDFGGGLAMEPPRSDDGSGGMIAEATRPQPRLDPSTYTTTVPFRPGGGGRMMNPSMYQQLPRNIPFMYNRQPSFGGFPSRGFGGMGSYGGMMGMGLGGGFGMGYPQMGGYGYGFGQGMGAFPRGGYGGFGGFGGGFRGYGSMGGYGMSPYQNQFQNQGMMNQGLGAYNSGMMQNQRQQANLGSYGFGCCDLPNQVGTLQPQQQQQVAQPQVQPQQQPMQAQQATPMQQQYQQAFY